MVDPLKLFWVLTNSTYLVTRFIRIGTVDEYDNPPYFEKVLYEAEVDENEDIQHTVLTVTAKVQNDSSLIRYEITSGNIGGAFGVGNITGAIYVAGALDYETRKRYELRLAAIDNMKENFTTVVIHVRDVNDNPPVFERSSYRTQITEEDDENLPKKVLQVTATDGDKDRLQNTIYFLTGQGIDPDNPGESNFDINSNTGEIFVLKALDRDLPNGRPQWRFTVFAQDDGGEGLVGYADVQINLTDINDNAPMFPLVVYMGNITENASAGMEVMTISAIDYDDPTQGSNAHLIYSIEKNVIEEDTGSPIFEIESKTGVIRTAVCCLDRERTPDYSIQIVATDGGGLKGTGTASIRVQDVNDMPPRFTKDEWFAEVNETDGVTISNETLLTVTVHDDDETNNFQYQVVHNSGYGSDKFKIVRNPDGTGSLKIIKHLDYEDPAQKNEYRFSIQVNDQGDNNFDDDNHVAHSWVVIKLRDINDNQPQFKQLNLKVSILENVEVGKTLATFKATDPDNGGNSKVSYAIDRSSDSKRQFSINQKGIVSVQRPLDREHTSHHQIRILAIDDGVPPRTATATLNVNVQDINDNAPSFLRNYRPTLLEHVPPIKVVEIQAIDNDEPHNGPPFQFWLDPNADDIIRSSFKVEQDQTNGKGKAIVSSLRAFDREEQKEYQIPIVIKDHGLAAMTGTSTLTVVIGDINDHKMKSGAKEILVYNYRGQAPDADIGRVFVNDLDDWDLQDKTFYWDGPGHPRFSLNELTGMISMRQGTRVGKYRLGFKVYDQKHKLSNVSADVTVTVKEIPNEAVVNSGSVRLEGVNEEDFIRRWHYKTQSVLQSKAEKFKTKMAALLKVDCDNVDLFSVQKKSIHPPVTDIRFSARELSYFKAEGLNGIVLMNREVIEEFVGVKIIMVGIDECLTEDHVCQGSCTNVLDVSALPYMVDANMTSLVGVRVDVIGECVCGARNFSLSETSCSNSPCYNGGRCTQLGNSFKCSCPVAFSGARCQEISRSFDGTGWAWYPPLEMCEQSHLHLEFVTKKQDGLLLYNGPIVSPNIDETILSDFIAVELEKGYPRLLIDFGSGTLELQVTTKQTLNDGEWHRVDIFWNTEYVRLIVDFCKSADIIETENGTAPKFADTSCKAEGIISPFNEYLNLNTPLQLGGLFIDQFDPLAYNWQFMPAGKGFNGCIRNLYHNSKLYDLAVPGLSRNSVGGCPKTMEVCGGYREHGTCIGSFHEAKCHCNPGWTGPACDLPTIPSTFKPQSYVKYALSFDPDKFSTEIQLRFRTREPQGELFRVSDQHNRTYGILEIKDARLRFRYNLNPLQMEERDVWLTAVSVDDGRWHVARVRRYGSVAILEMDGGEGREYNESFTFVGHQWILVDKQEGIYAGGKADYSGVRTYEVYADYQNGCLDDIRLDGKHLPLPPAINGTQWGQATMGRNLERSCPSNNPCANVLCPEPFECIDQWNQFVCTCAEGRVMSADGKDCTDKDECKDLPCLNGGTCINQLRLRYRCNCMEGFWGENCELSQEGQTLQLSIGALAAILACLLIILVLVLAFVVYSRRREANIKSPRVEDVRENIINYDDEGGGEDDMTAFDIKPLQIPIGGPVTEPSKMSIFMEQYKIRVDGDVNALPFDDLRNYAYEGAGSIAGSLHSIASDAET